MKKLLKVLKSIGKKDDVSKSEIETVEDAIEEDNVGFGIDTFAKSMLALEHKVRTQGNILKVVGQHASELLEAIKKVDDKIDILTTRIDGFEKRRFKKK